MVTPSSNLYRGVSMSAKSRARFALSSLSRTLPIIKNTKATIMYVIIYYFSPINRTLKLKGAKCKWAPKISKTS